MGAHVSGMEPRLDVICLVRYIRKIHITMWAPTLLQRVVIGGQMFFLLTEMPKFSNFVSNAPIMGEYKWPTNSI